MPSAASVSATRSADVHVRAVRDDREVVAGAPQRGLADRHRRRRRVGERLLDARIAIERDVLVVEDRIGIGDGATPSARARRAASTATTIFSPGVR